MSSTRIIDCGLKDYQSVLNLQENALQSLLAGTGKDTIFITEHQPVITLGARDSANKLSKDPDTIKQSGIEIFQIRRDGRHKITMHPHFPPAFFGQLAHRPNV